MKKHLLNATALATTIAFLITSPAGAVDWSGFYVGMGLGGATGDGTVSTNNYGGDTFSESAFIPTLAMGYNWDHGQFVLGAEGDVNPLGFQTTGTTGGGASFDAELKQLMTARLRAGIKVDKAVLFATAGLASGIVNLDTSYTDGGKGSVASNASAVGTVLGVTAGVGAEYEVSDGVSLKADALYYALEPLSAGTPDGDFPHTSSFSTSGVVVRAGVNIRFP